MVAKVAIDRARLPVLRKKRGVWVYRSGKPAEASIPDLLEEQRRQRTRQVYKEGGLKAAPGLSPAQAVCLEGFLRVLRVSVVNRF